MPRAAEEAGEEIEGIVVAAGTASSFVVGEAVMAVLVVDLARGGVGESFVCFGDFEETLLVAGGFVGVVLFGEGAVGAFEVAFGAGFVEAEGFVEVVGGECEG